ncbi:MAG: radical SAM protein [Chloroflexi bacterium]|nr:radical SAM protein [Chloroflexota bacterium]
MHPLKDLRDASIKLSHRTVGKILGRLAASSGEDFVGLLRMTTAVSRHEELNCFVSGIIEMLSDPEHPASTFFERVMGYLSPYGRQRLFQTLLYNCWIWGHLRRKRLTEIHGIANFPIVLVLSPSNACNLKCEGCYASGYGRADSLPPSLVKRILEECEELGIFLVVLSGGEPLLYPHTMDMIEKSPYFFFHIYTNGTLITPAIAERLSQLGNVLVLISLEGFQESTDQRRGTGVFGRILESFAYLREFKVPFGTSITVTRRNLEEVTSFEFLEFLITQGVLMNYYFMYLPVDGSGDFSLMLSPEQRDFLRSRLQAIRSNIPLLIIDFWNDGPYVRGCIAGGKRYFHINARGDMEPCVFTHFATDNIKDTTILEALKSPLFTAIRARQPYDSNHLCPCMIIDSPWVARELIEKYEARPTHYKGLSIYSDHYDKLLEFSEEYRRIADKVWQEEWHGKGFFE